MCKSEGRMIFNFGLEKSEVPPEIAKTLFTYANRGLLKFISGEFIPGWEYIADGRIMHETRAQKFFVSGYRVKEFGDFTFCITTPSNKMLSLYRLKLRETHENSDIYECLAETPYLCSWNDVSYLADFLERFFR